jgi:hypothetical protein
VPAGAQAYLKPTGLSLMQHCWPVGQSVFSSQVIGPAPIMPRHALPLPLLLGTQANVAGALPQHTLVFTAQVVPPQFTLGETQFAWASHSSGPDAEHGVR